MSSESWLRMNCSGCSKCNWICQGDVSDLTAFDIEGFECWSCGKKQWLDEYMIDNYGYLKGKKTPEEILEDAILEIGVENPNV